MDTPTLRILDTLTSHLGEPLSISQLTKKIKERYGNAYYANTYQKLKELQKDKMLLIEKYGNASIIKPNFDNFLIIDWLAEMETEKKLNFIEPRDHLSIILEDLKDAISNNCFIKSVSLINPLRNFHLNRFELLFIMSIHGDLLNEVIQLYKSTLLLQNKYNLRIDSLVLTEQDFSWLLRSNEINPIREAIAKETTIFGSEALWSEIREISQQSHISVIQEETKPNKISESDLIANLYRFGYVEFGSTITESNRYCVEYVITALLLSEDARRIDAVPTILAKNEFRENLLAFLSQKYRTTGKLLGLMKILQKISPNDQVKRTISVLQTFGEEEIPGNERSVIRNMELYNAVKQ